MDAPQQSPYNPQTSTAQNPNMQSDYAILKHADGRWGVHLVLPNGKVSEPLDLFLIRADAMEFVALQQKLNRPIEQPRQVETKPQSSDSGSIQELIHQRKIILSTPHWRAIPEYKVELKATNQAIRLLTGAKAVKRAVQWGSTPRQQPQADAPKPEGGDRALVTRYDDGQLIDMWCVVLPLDIPDTSRKGMYRGQFEDGIHYFVSSAIKKIEKAG